MDAAGRPGRAAVPVLLYHAVTDDPGAQIAPFTVRPADFDRHLDLVVASGRRCVTFGELVRREAAGEPVDGLVVITFDDGYADFAASALPRLARRGLDSTLYLTTGWLEGGGTRTPGPTDRMLDVAQLAELAEQGVELGAHSHSHPQMDTLGASALEDELTRPRAILEDVLGRPVTEFAYPHGYHGPRVRRATQRAGYRSGAGVRNRPHHPGEDRFAVSRLMLAASTRPEDVAAWLGEADADAAPSREAWRTRGWRAYRRGRALLSRRPGSDYA